MTTQSPGGALAAQLDAWRENVGALEGHLGTAVQKNVDYDVSFLVGATSTLVRLVDAESSSLEDLQATAHALTASRDRLLEELGQSLAVNAVVVCGAEAVSREWYRICESVGAELVCFNDPYDRPRLAEVVTMQPDKLPSTHPSVHSSHRSAAEHQAELDTSLADDDDVDEAVHVWDMNEQADPPVPHVDDWFDDTVDEAAIRQSWSWNDTHPYELRIFIDEEPDFEMPPVSLEGLSGAALAERRVQLARAYMGFDPDAEGAYCPLHTPYPERVFFLYNGPALLEYRKPPRPARRRPSVRVGAASRVAKGLYLTASTRVSPDPPAEHVEEELTPVDDGHIVITSRRIAFVGDQRHHEWPLDRLASTRVVPLDPGLPVDAFLIAVTNRRKMSGFVADRPLVSTLELMIQLASCQSFEERQVLVRRLAAARR